ncbi:MAG: amidohydrolase family protein [Planctomycetes bacterium]|nr:amidohydrolase family protein [Planctomycetota bacterium]
MLLELLCTCAILAAPAAPANSVRQDAALVLRADKLLLGDGTTLEGGAILIEGGRIRAFGKDVDVPAGAGTITHNGWVSAGLVALHSYAGAPDEMSDGTRPVLEGKVAWAFDPAHSDFAKALAAGVTTIVLAPQPDALCGGASAVVKTAGRNVLADEAQLALSFSAAALSPNRFPTSYASAVAELDTRFDKPEGLFARAKSGELPVLFDADTREDVLRVLGFAKRHSLRGAIYGADWIGELAPQVKASQLAAIISPLDAGEDRRTLKSVVALAKADVPFGFGLDSPFKDPQTLRLSAALCLREGLDRARAWRALSSQAAQIAGVGDRVGRIEKGLDADLVLWSGDPLDLKSRVDAVLVDGQRVYEAKQP